MLLHERDAFREMNEILNKYQTMLPPVVIHCFTGSRQEAIKYIGMGCYIGITGRFISSTSLMNSCKHKLIKSNMEVGWILAKHNCRICLSMKDTSGRIRRMESRLCWGMMIYHLTSFSSRQTRHSCSRLSTRYIQALRIRLFQFIGLCASFYEI